jgi:hypothetical protein
MSWQRWNVQAPQARRLQARRFGAVLALASGIAALSNLVSTSANAQGGNDLRPPSAFATIEDSAARSRALFSEAAKVIMNPRCMNCHPAGDSPLQGNDKHRHIPPVVRGEAGVGAPGNQCAACHMQGNYTLLEPATTYESIPGHPRWGLAPVEMAWEGKSAGEICAQLKDPNRNGGRDLPLLHEHIAHDDLVAWGWNPGNGRAPAPGSQARLGELVQAWIDTGAHCPQ